MRVGMGYDVHRLVPERDLIIGGVKIPYEKGLLGHSDADVLLHAIMDALLGAAALGDIGKHFRTMTRHTRGQTALCCLEELGRFCPRRDMLLKISTAQLLPRSLRWHRTLNR